MKRRTFLTNSALAAGACALPASAFALSKKNKPALTIAHITDVHIRPEENIPQRASDWLAIVKKHKPDFFLNGGDTIHDASYGGTTKSRVLEQWAEWDNFRDLISNYEVHSCIGNHDIWWDDPTKKDPLYGKKYTVERLQIPGNYYSFSKNGWHFIVLDSNHSGVTLGDEQTQWLQKELASLPANTPTLLMSHYPITSITDSLVGGQHSDHKELKNLFYQHKDKVRVCVSGHQHMLDRVWYNGVNYFCNGSLSGYWWGKGDKQSAGPQFYLETPPGYAIMKLYADGSVENEYFPLTKAYQ